ncbi:MAG: hypothetical protein J7J91_08930 [Deltaproteobacteria bacterium]|nr:hypothetical protein [Deltaproteobacteria bacterium]
MRPIRLRDSLEEFFQYFKSITPVSRNGTANIQLAPLSADGVVRIIASKTTQFVVKEL